MLVAGVVSIFGGVPGFRRCAGRKIYKFSFCPDAPVVCRKPLVGAAPNQTNVNIGFGGTMR